MESWHIVRWVIGVDIYYCHYYFLVVHSVTDGNHSLAMLSMLSNHQPQDTSPIRFNGQTLIRNPFLSDHLFRLIFHRKHIYIYIYTKTASTYTERLPLHRLVTSNQWLLVTFLQTQFEEYFLARQTKACHVYSHKICLMCTWYFVIYMQYYCLFRLRLIVLQVNPGVLVLFALMTLKLQEQLQMMNILFRGVK